MSTPRRFPENGDDIDAAEPSSWRRHDFGWSPADEDVWERLLADPQFERLLRDFTFGFILCTQLPGSEFLEVVKFAYKQTLPYAVLRREAAGLVPVELNVDAPAVGQLRSYHLRVEGPPGLHLTDVALFRTFEEADEAPVESVPTGQTDDTPSPRSNAGSQAPSHPPEGVESSETIVYQRRLTPEWAQIYTTPAAPAGFVYKVAVHLRVPLAGFLRSAWMASVFVFGVLIVGRVALADVQARLTERSEAAIALLLVGPSLLSAYVVRPDEHAITSRLLRSVRYAVAASGLAGYVAAGSLLIAERTTDLRVLWTALVGLAGAVAGYVTVVVVTTWWNIRTAGKQSGSTNTSEIIDVYFTK